MYWKARIFIKANKKAIQFIFLFILFFFIGQVAYHVAEPYTKQYIIPKGIAEAGSTLINLLTPQEKTVVKGELIQSGSFTLRIAVGCDGFEALLIVVAGIVAFSSMGWRTKLLGVLAGSFIIYLVNLLRIIVLYYTSKYKPAIFEMMHVYVGQTFIILIGCLFFLYWINAFAKTE